MTHLTHLRLYCRMQLSAVCTGEQISCGYKAAQTDKPPQHMSGFTHIQPVAANTYLELD